MFRYDCNILVVDDMRGMRMFVIKQLKSLGFTNFIEAEDGKAAWETIQNSDKTIDLIFSDINMPNMSGIDLLEKIRSDEKFMNIPLILVTAELESKTQKRAQEAGVTDYIVKPIRPEAICEKLRKIETIVSR